MSRKLAVVRLGLVVLFIVLTALPAHAQRADRRVREHEVNQSHGFVPEPADVPPPAASVVSIEVEGAYRVIVADGIPEHDTGRFPNGGNPHSIRTQRYSFRVPSQPVFADTTTPLGLHNFGIGVNGVPFDPGAAEWYLGDSDSGWQYEALSGAIPLGLDANNAHVQPSGAYHYHGLPNDLLDDLGVEDGVHSPLVGWAADGFPIYAIYGYADPDDPESPIRELRSSYRLRSGQRPTGTDDPGGTYDGTFLADYELVKGAGDLDVCNGRTGVTPEFPEGTYAYYLTRDWPVIPRCYRGHPDKSFTEQRL